MPGPAGGHRPAQSAITVDELPQRCHRRERQGESLGTCRLEVSRANVCPVTTPHNLIGRVVRGEEAPEALERVGVRIETRNGSIKVTPPSDMSVPPYPLSDLARGLLINWAVGTDLPKWATTMLMVDAIQFVEADSPQEGRLLDAVWAAMTDQPIDDDALDLARRLTS